MNMSRFIMSFHWLSCVLMLISHSNIVYSSSSSSLYTNVSSNSAHLLCSLEESSALLHFKRAFILNSSSDSYQSYECGGYFDAHKGCYPTMLRSFPKTKNWKVGSDCCLWKGVTCDEVSGHVIKLDLSFSQLQGTLYSNSSLFQLSHLQSLSLAFNDFMGSKISSEFGQFAHLTHLNLSHSGFSYAIPIEISNLRKLTHLDLSWNELSGQISSTVFSSFEQIKFLDLSANYFQGQINFLANLTKLTHLGLFENAVDVSSKVFSNLRQLEFLTLSGIQFGGPGNQIFNSLANLTKLTHLGLSSCELTGEISSTIFSNLEQLEFLDLSGNQFEGRIPKSVSNLTKLSYLSLPDCEFSGELSSAFFSNLNQLEYLDLSSNSLQGHIPDSFHNLNKLKVVKLDWNGFTGGFPFSFANLSQLSHLRISHNFLTGHIPANGSGFQLISEIDLSFNDFNGNIPSSLFALPFLASLNLEGNQLTGEIPHNLGNLLNLFHLTLSSNFILGLIPSSLFSLPSIETIQLQNNKFFGSIPSNVTGLQKLDTLNLSNNTLSGAIPSALLALPSLSFLDLSNNKLTGHVSEFQSNLLQHIHLSNNDLQGINFSSISNLVNLTTLKLASINLHGTLEIDVFLGFQQLDLVDLSYNNHLSLNSSDKVYSSQLSRFLMSNCNVSVFPFALKNLVQLEELDLSSNKIQGPVPEWLKNIGKSSTTLSLNLSHNFLTSTFEILPWTNLILIDLSFNLIQGALPVPPDRLSIYDISNNQLSGKIHPNICKSEPWIIDFSNNNLSGNIPDCLLKVGNVVDLRRNNLSGTIPKTVGSFLTRLYLSHNCLQGQIPRSLANFTSLEVLDVGYNYISDTFPSWMETVTELKILILRNNKFYGIIEKPRNASLAFAQLSIIDLSYNKFSGHLPSHYFHLWKSMMMTGDYHSFMAANYSDLVNLTNKGQLMELAHTLPFFRLVDFSNNNFEGGIPESIGELKSLIVLNLSSNGLTGGIPPSLGNLAQLQSFDLSNNKLSGRIPTELNSLTFLGAFNVSQNKLEGPIPQTGQLSTFPYDSYKGNLGLCGLQVPKKCEEVHPPIISSEQEEDSDTLLNGFTWKPVVIGYGCGMVIGIVAGNIIIRRNEEWVLSFFNIRLLWRFKKSNTV